jgi:hypothetical protein
MAAMCVGMVAVGMPPAGLAGIGIYVSAWRTDAQELLLVAKASR